MTNKSHPNGSRNANPILPALAGMLLLLIVSGLHAQQALPPEVAKLQQQKLKLEAAPVNRVIKGVRPASDGKKTYIVQLQDPPLALFAGGQTSTGEELAATNARVRGEKKLNPDSKASRDYLQFLDDVQADVRSRIGEALGRELTIGDDPLTRAEGKDVLFHYRAAVNGMAIRLTPAEAQKIASVPGIVSVREEQFRHIDTDRGPHFIRADRVWNGELPGGLGTQGEGIVVGVIDTGLNLINDFPSDHPSFSAVSDDAFLFQNPLGEGNFRGWCDPANPNFDIDLQCNAKVLGAYSFTQDNTPNDENGHGSHVSSIAVGNLVNGVTIPTTTIQVDISGVAPHAHLIMYEVCDDDFTGACPLSAILGGQEAIIMDADIVDVANFSIGGGSNNPWVDADALGFLSAREAGIMVATSAGNSGPDAATIGSPADAPWITSVANQTHDRVFGNELVDMAGGDTAPPADISGASLTEGFGSAPIVLAGDFDNGTADPQQCLEPFPEGTFSGEIVVCDRGTIARVQKGANVLAGGAGGFVLANTDDQGESTVADPHVLPGIHIGDTAGDELRAWLASGAGHMARITTSNNVNVPAAGDIMASSSSRGPNPAFAGIIKPNVSTPGTNIFAAFGNMSSLGDTFGFLSGTSMASPHTAGSAALVRQLHPAWTAAEVHSALVMTAVESDMILKEDGETPSDPFDRGGGRTSPFHAAQALLVLDETGSNFSAANPAFNGDPTQLNLPDLGNGKCIQNCSWTRTFRMVDDGILVAGGSPDSTSWVISFDVPAGVVMTATPSSFTLNVGETQIVTFEADVTAAPEGWQFGEAVLALSGFNQPAGSGVQTDSPQGIAFSQHLPVAINASFANIPDAALQSRRDTGSRVVSGLETIATSSLEVQSSGLVKATETALNLVAVQDQAEFTKVVTVPPEGAARLVAQIMSDESPDSDVIVLGPPSFGTLVCAPFTAGSDERCDIRNPDPGDYAILVDNFTGSMDQPDAITLYDALVPNPTGDSGNLQALTGEALTSSIPQASPWDLRVRFNEPAMQAGERWYGALSLGKAGAPGALGLVPVDMLRIDDDVVKTADRDFATTGDIVTYTITVNTNLGETPLSYTINDKIPDGLTLVPGSLSASAGGVSSAPGGRIIWQGTMDPLDFVYEVSTNASNPACDTGFGGYVNLEAFGIPPADLGTAPDDPIDTQAFVFFDDGGAPIDLFGQPHTGFAFGDDGFALGPDNSLGAQPWVPQLLPDPADPNNLAAMLWQDMEIVNDPANFKGLSAALTGTGPGDLIIAEYDDVRAFASPLDTTQTVDFEIVMRRQPSDAPGVNEVVFAYNNLNAPLDNFGFGLTVGVENNDASQSTALVNQDDATGVIGNSTVVCFDLQQFGTPITISYQAEVTMPLPPEQVLKVNDAIHITDEVNDRLAVSSAEVSVGDAVFVDDFE